MLLKLTFLVFMRIGMSVLKHFNLIPHGQKVFGEHGGGDSAQPL